MCSYAWQLAANRFLNTGSKDCVLFSMPIHKQGRHRRHIPSSVLRVGDHAMSQFPPLLSVACCLSAVRHWHARTSCWSTARTSCWSTARTSCWSTARTSCWSTARTSCWSTARTSCWSTVRTVTSNSSGLQGGRNTKVCVCRLYLAEVLEVDVPPVLKRWYDLQPSSLSTVCHVETFNPFRVCYLQRPWLTAIVGPLTRPRKLIVSVLHVCGEICLSAEEWVTVWLLPPYSKWVQISSLLSTLSEKMVPRYLKRSTCSSQQLWHVMWMCSFSAVNAITFVFSTLTYCPYLLQTGWWSFIFQTPS